MECRVKYFTESSIKRYIEHSIQHSIELTIERSIAGSMPSSNENPIEPFHLTFHRTFHRTFDLTFHRTFDLTGQHSLLEQGTRRGIVAHGTQLHGRLGIRVLCEARGQNCTGTGPPTDPMV